MRTFIQVLVNTAVANITTSFLWFALTFWVYLETQSVLATGIIGGAYMLFVALFSMVFGTIVDRHRKHVVMVVLQPRHADGLRDRRRDLPCAAGVRAARHRRAVVLALLRHHPVRRRDREHAQHRAVHDGHPARAGRAPRERERHGRHGAGHRVRRHERVQRSRDRPARHGLDPRDRDRASRLLALVHIALLRIPEDKPARDGGRQPIIDFRGSVRAIRSAPGLFALIIFSTFNNLIGGVYMALMDPYGLTLFPVEWWGVVLGVASTGFIIGGIVIAKRGLGRNPIRTMLLVVVAMGLLGALFTIREWWWLYAVGIWLYMALIPAVEASEQTVIQKVVPFATQGRVFGFAAALESAAAPITAFLIAPIAQFWIIPYMKSDAGQQTWGWLLGDGEARGIALVFLVSGLIMVVVALLAFTSRSYRTLSEEYQRAPETDEDDGAPVDDGDDRARCRIRGG